MTVVKRTRKQANGVRLSFEPAVVKRVFIFELPEEFGFDHEDADDISRALLDMAPPPEEVQTPIPSGCGDLVYSAFVVTFVDDSRTDDEIHREILKAVRSALRPRTWEFA